MDHRAGLEGDYTVGHSITLVLQCFPFVTCCEPVAASSVGMAKSREEREGGRSLWVKGIDRQLWDPTSRDHTPASRGFHSNMPEMRDCVR